VFAKFRRLWLLATNLLVLGMSVRFSRNSYDAKIGDKHQSVMSAKLVLHQISDNYFLNLRIRRKYPEPQVLRSAPLKHRKEESAVVIQGPLVSDFDFTYWTLRLLRDHNPESVIIFSTWDSASKTSLSRIQDLGVICTIQQIPSKPISSNLLLQWQSTNAGLEAAKSLNVKSVFRQRSDQRMTRPNLMRSLNAIYEMESQTAVARRRQSEPILALSVGTLKFRLYGLSDFAQFGTIETLDNYWRDPIDTGRTSEQLPQPIKGVLKVNLGDDTRLIFGDFQSGKPINTEYLYEDLGAEQLLFRRFLHRCGSDPSWNLQDYWECLARHAVVVDGSSLDFFWPKYSFLEKFDCYNFGLPDRPLVTFSDWLSYRQNL
jgi:hypothetical protein